MRKRNGEREAARAAVEMQREAAEADREHGAQDHRQRGAARVQQRTGDFERGLVDRHAADQREDRDQEARLEQAEQSDAEQGPARPRRVPAASSRASEAMYSPKRSRW